MTYLDFQPGIVVPPHTSLTLGSSLGSPRCLLQCCGSMVHGGTCSPIRRTCCREHRWLATSSCHTFGPTEDSHHTSLKCSHPVNEHSSIWTRQFLSTWDPSNMYLSHRDSPLVRLNETFSEPCWDLRFLSSPSFFLFFHTWQAYIAIWGFLPSPDPLAGLIPP